MFPQALMGYDIAKQALPPPLVWESRLGCEIMGVPLLLSPKYTSFLAKPAPQKKLTEDI